jgi:flagellar biosynthesis protein FlhF
MVRTFQAKDMKDALSAMRAALGEDAVILSSEKAGDGSVLVCAAPGEQTPAASKPSGIASFETRYRDRLLAKLRAKPESPAAGSAPFSRPDLLAQLRAHRTPDSLAHALAQAAEASGFEDPALALASALDKRMKIAPVNFEKDRTILLAGPFGAGKTAIAAKLAAEAISAGRKVRLAAADLKSAGGRERLETFAVHLDVPVIDASSPRHLSEAAAEARNDGALLIVDTAGFDPRDPPHEILMCTRMGCAEAIGVVSAAMDAEEAGEIAAALKTLGIERLIVTCIDLARRKGSLAAFAASGLAIAHATASPYLVEGLDSLTPPALARALLSPLDDRTSEA